MPEESCVRPYRVAWPEGLARGWREARPAGAPTCWRCCPLHLYDLPDHAAQTVFCLGPAVGSQDDSVASDPLVLAGK